MACFVYSARVTDTAPTNEASARSAIGMVVGLLLLGPVGAVAMTPSAVGRWRGPDAIFGVSPTNFEEAVVAGLVLGAIGAVIALVASNWLPRIASAILGALVEGAGLAALWVLKSSPLGLLFPVLIAMLVPIRRMLNRFFDPAHLAALDAEEEAEVFEETGGGKLGP